MTTPIVTEIKPDQPAVGERTELGRYIVGADERIVYGHRVDGVVRITDVPASGSGRAYLIERGLERDGFAAVNALVSDYVAQAEALGAIPMSVSPLGRYLDQLRS